MPKTSTSTPKITRGDKIHKKFIDRLNILNDNLVQSSKVITIVNKQSLDSSAVYYEKVAKSQESERVALCDIIKTCEDESKRREAFERLAELDKLKEKDIKNHNEFIQSERDVANRNIIGNVLLFAVATGLISNKQIRRKTGKTFTQISQKLLGLKE